MHSKVKLNISLILYLLVEYLVKKATKDPTSKNIIIAKFHETRCKCINGSEDPEQTLKEINEQVDAYNAATPKDKSGPVKKYTACRPLNINHGSISVGNEYIPIQGTSLSRKSRTIEGFSNTIAVFTGSTPENPLKIHSLTIGKFKPLKEGEELSIVDANPISTIQDHEHFWMFHSKRGILKGLGDNEYSFEAYYEPQHGESFPGYKVITTFTYLPIQAID